MSQTKSRDNFVAILESFEKLVSEEAFAIRQNNFDYLDDVLAKKKNTLNSLVAAKEPAGINRENEPILYQRIDQVISHQADNEKQIAQCLQANLKQQTERRNASVRLKGVRGAYGSSLTPAKQNEAKKQFQA